MLTFINDIYPQELVLIPDNFDGKSTHFLDLNITIEEDNIISTSIFDKRDDFNFPIINFPHLDDNIPKNSEYGVFIGELVRYARACTYFHDFKDRTLVLIKKLLNQSFKLQKLKNSFLKFCNYHVLSIQKYGSDILNVNNIFSF